MKPTRRYHRSALTSVLCPGVLFLLMTVYAAAGGYARSVLPADGDYARLQPVDGFIPQDGATVWDFSVTDNIRDAFDIRFSRATDSCLSVTMPGIRYDFTIAGDTVFRTAAETHFMRAAGRAMFTVYDEAARVAVTGMCNDDAMADGVTIPSMTAPFDETATGLCGTGYLADSLDYLQNAKLMTAAYYDSYDFLGLDAFGAVPYETYVHAPANGLVTGTLTGVLENPGDGPATPTAPIAAVTYYDSEERPVRTVSTTHLPDTYEETETSYTLDGQPRTVSHTLTKGDKTYTDAYEYTYDNVGRLDKVMASFPDREEEICICENRYSSIGLLSRTFSDCMMTDYGYDIRGAVSFLSNDAVYQQISHTPGGAICNIMENGIKHIYEYDRAGRLLSETVDNGGSLGGVYSSSYTYDRNSNVTSLIRTGYPTGQI